jgi:predicted AlkP superfamily pyrophosphatase or phosphodiesterase
MYEDRYFLYINFDGFGKYYYDIANTPLYGGTPNINKIISEGVFFTNAWTGIPSITYPMQSAIVSGAYSEVTGNVYKYYDKNENKIVICRRTNVGETIGEILRREQIPFVSVQQFALEGKGADYDKKNALYIQPGGNYLKRFNSLRRLLTGKKVRSKDNSFRFDNIPKAIFLYMDDLDSIGHNPLYTSGKYKAFNENMRIRNVVTQLIKMDKELGKLIELLENIGIYENTDILITTDHGMVPYKGKSSIGRLKSIFNDMGYKNIRCLNSDENLKEVQNVKSEKEPKVSIISTGIEAQIYVKNISQSELNNIKNTLEKEEFIEYCFTKDDLKKRGTCEHFADLLISPLPPYHFNMQENKNFLLSGGHDSLNERAQHIFAVIKGKDFKRKFIYNEEVYNIDFIPTFSHVLNIPFSSNYKGRVLNDIINKK